MIKLDILGLVFFTALFLSLFFVPATILIARKLGAVDIPKSRSSHSIPTTRLGGLGIAASLILSCLMFLQFNVFVWAFLVGLLVIVVTGLVDDIADIGPRWKFVGQIVAAGSFVFMGGGTLENLGDFLGSGEITLGWLAVPLTIFCMVGGINAFNLSDGLDGLAAGLAVIAAVFLAYLSWQVGGTDLLLVCVSLLGALLGFLRYNNYPARLFMGDCGSLMLGYVLTAVLVSGSQRDVHHISLVSWTMVIALPLLDTLFVMARRIYYKQSPFMPDRTHFHHRLMALNLAHPGVVAVMYAVMAFFGMLALVTKKYPDWYAFSAILALAAILFGGISGLQHLGFTFNVGRLKQIFSTGAQWPVHRKISTSLASGTVYVSLSLLLLLCLPSLFFPLPELNQNEVLSLLILAGMVVFYGNFYRAHVYEGMLHGSVYVSIFTLFFLYNQGAVGNGHWTGVYLTTISMFAAVWVLFKVVFRQKVAILIPSSFELLMVLLSWFLPFVFFQELRFPTDLIDAGRLACLQALPFMLATKIYFSVRPLGDKRVVSVLAGTVTVVALMGWVN